MTSPNDSHSGTKWLTAPLVLATVIGICTLGSAAIMARAGVEVFRIKHSEKRIVVTGSATKRIHSDLVVWRARVKSQATDMSQAYKKLSADVPTVVAFLKSHGIDE